MNKKGQVTMFIIIGVVMVVMILFLVLISKAIDDSEKNGLAKYPEIKTNVELAHKKALECTAYTLGKSGGFTELNEGLASIEESIKAGSILMTDLIPDIFNPSSLEEKGYTIVQGEIKSTVNFGINDISADTLHELEVSKTDDELEKLDKFYVDDNIRYNHLHEYAEAQDQDINLNELVDADFNVNVYEAKNSSVFVFTDPKSKLDQEDYKFMFK